MHFTLCIYMSVFMKVVPYILYYTRGWDCMTNIKLITQFNFSIHDTIQCSCSSLVTIVDRLKEEKLLTFNWKLASL